jgi:VIT1/CCC1 family predicted Fe2+/Mn2+ transporter
MAATLRSPTGLVQDAPASASRWKGGPDNPHGTVGGNALRAAVLGANDGLVSNLSLVMGVAGADLDGRAIIITGIAGLLAGASSMAMGEWVSVQSSRELYARQIAIERREIEETPEKEAAEFVEMYMAKGLSEPLAREVSAQLMENPEHALDTMVREELGINPADLGGSAWEAAGASFALFAVGAILPVLPFIFMSGLAAVWASLAVSALALLIMGSAITVITGRHPLFSGARQLLFGMAAAGLTFAIGKLIGVTIAG